MTTIAWRTKLTLLAGVTLAATALTLAFAGPTAGAAPTAGGGKSPAARNGDNGTVKIHRSTTPVPDPRNEPHVCIFYLDAFGFDPGQSVSWQIKSWPPTGDRSVVSSGALALDGNGAGFTGDMALPNGHYKLYWNFNGEHGFAKQKVFWVACPPPSPSPSPSPSGTPSSSPSQTPTPSPSGTPSSSPSVSPPSTSTATPSPSLSATPGSSSGPPSPGGLPVTGWPLALIAAAGVALLGTGGAAVVAARRRRGLHSR